MRSRPVRSVRRAAGARPALAAAAVLGLLAATSIATPALAATGFRALNTLPGLGSGRIWSVAVDPSQPTTILVGSDRGVYQSRNSGLSWALSLAGPRVWVVGFDVRHASEAFAGTAGSGLFASADSGGSWSASSTGLNNRDVRALAFGLDGIAAATGNGVYESPDGHAWHDSGLDGDSVSAITVAANAPQFTVVAGIDNGNLASGYLYRSAPGGTWASLQSGLPAGAVATALGAGPIDQAVPQRPLVAVTTKGVYRSGDGGTTWTSATGVPTALTATTAVFDPLDPTVVYAGADQGGSTGGDMLRSTDGGMTFSVSDAGLPQPSKNVEAIALAPTNPLTVVVALDPPNAGGALYVETDASLPAPPVLTPEAPGAPVTTVVSTPPPSQSATPRPVPATPAPQSSSGFGGFVGTAFHWPTPLIFEIILVLLIAYVVVRWRQHYYVEGPP